MQLCFVSVHGPRETYFVVSLVVSSRSFKTLLLMNPTEYESSYISVDDGKGKMRNVTLSV
jgi:hypothetical protein